MTLRSLENITFRNSFVDELPSEIAPHSHSRHTPGVCSSQIKPTPVRDPQLVAWSDDLAALLNLEKPDERGPAVDILAGNSLGQGSKPFAARYGGHQFGHWAGQLGDGRAISLGEIEARDGSSWEIQLKGAGPTPYSRRADGRAVLRSSVREFLCSEAMHHLGVPTTRALSLVATGDTVVRDMFYSGNPQPEKGAIVARVSPSFVRFGNFEILTASGEIENLKTLADYVLRHHYPELVEGQSEYSEEVYLRWFEEISRRTAVMIVHWMTVGFVHGVMNTDNMSILGLTIDYGPYGWLEPYDPEWTPNTTDLPGRRYAYAQQARIALWNLAKLAQALSPLVSDIEKFQSGLEAYQSAYVSTHYATMLRKLGLTQGEKSADSALFEELENVLESSQMDMTIFFRQLSHLAPQLKNNGEYDEKLFHQLVAAASYLDNNNGVHHQMRDWLQNYAARLRQENADAESIHQTMLRANPKYVLRNYLAQQAIDAADNGDLSVLQRLMRVLETPFDEHDGHDELAAKRPDWARDKPGCATLSCSS